MIKQGSILKALAFVVMVLTVLCVFTGCATRLVHENARSAVQVERARAAVVQGADLGDGAVGLAFDVSAWEAFKEAPLKHLGAGLADAAMVAGSIWAADALYSEINGSNDSPGTQIIIEAGGDAQVTLQGDNAVDRSSEEIAE